jgi:hypothetical protein
MLWTAQPNGLAAKLLRDRQAEMTGLAHGRAARGIFAAARIASFGLYHHLEKPTAERLAQIDRQRRITYYSGRLRELLDSSPKPEVIAPVSEIEDSVAALSALADQSPSGGKVVAKLVARIFRQTSDDALRQVCIDSLRKMQHEEAGRVLAKLLAEPDAAAWLHRTQQASLRDLEAGPSSGSSGADEQ